MSKLLNILALTSLAFGAGAASEASAQQALADGSFSYGGVRLYENEPSPAKQNAKCQNALQRGLGVVGMSFYGVEPWLKNHPQLERNCVTLLDIPPIANSPHRAEMLRASQGLWSRMVRVRVPANEFGWREGYGFAWCSDRTCDRNVLTTFSATQIIGFCSADRRAGGTRYVLAEQFRDAVTTAVAPYNSCITDPKSATEEMARVGEMAGARRVTAPVGPQRVADGGGRTEDGARIQGELNRQARDDQRLAAEAAQEQARAAAQWQRLSRPNELGW